MKSAIAYCCYVFISSNSFPPLFFVSIQNEVKRIDFTEAFHSFAVSLDFSPTHIYFLFRFACYDVIEAFALVMFHWHLYHPTKHSYCFEQ